MSGKKSIFRLLNEDDISSNLIGRQVYVLWPDNGLWYRGVVKRCNVATASATIYYTETKEEERADLQELITGKEIAFKEACPLDHALAEDEVEVPVSQAQERAPRSDLYVSSDEDDSIMDAGARDVESDTSDSSLDPLKAGRKRPHLRYSDEEDDGKSVLKDSHAAKRKRRPAIIGGKRRAQDTKAASNNDLNEAEVRLKVRAVLSQALQLAEKELQQEGRDVAGVSVEQVAAEIEKALVELHGLVTKEYKSKVRSLQFNLRDPHNPDLRAHVLLGDISPIILAKMSAAELASKELAEYRKKKEEEALKMAVLDAEAAAKFSTAAALDARDKLAVPATLAADRLPSAHPGSPAPQSNALFEEHFHHNANEGLVLPFGDPVEASEDPIPWANVKAQTLSVTQSLNEQSSFELPALEALRPSLQPGVEVGNHQSMPAVDLPISKSVYQDLFFPSVLHHDVKPWQAQVVVPGSGSYPMVAESLAGMHDASLLMGHGDVHVRGRVALSKLRSFLFDLRSSKHRTATLGILRPDVNCSDQHIHDLRQLIDQYVTKQRSGVTEASPGVEVYLVPPCTLATELLETARETSGNSPAELKLCELLAVAIYQRSWQPREPQPPPAPVLQVGNLPSQEVELPQGLDLNAISSLAQILGVAAPGNE